jgi:anaerobic selenocysteine-containing dehydrogenase
MPQEVRRSVCALDCPDTCSVLVTVENGRATRLRGNPSHPITRGFLCGKVARYLDREYHPERLMFPQKRIGRKGEGRFERISWDEALDAIAARLQATAAEHGPESILPYSYAGNMGLLNYAGMDRRFFHKLGASRLDRTICSSAGGAGITAQLGYRFGTEPEQFVHSRLILAWGANILGTNVHLWPFIVEARRKGAKLIVIDPVKNRTGAVADEWIPINPGSDLALALGLMHVILAEGLEDQKYVSHHTDGIEELRQRAKRYTPEVVESFTGVPRHRIVSLARQYATTRPAVIRLNYGVQRSERGGAAVRAITALPALIGSWQEVGGGCQLTTSGAFALNTASLEMPELQPKPARILNMSQLGTVLRETRDPAIHALVVYNSNPAAIAPDQNAVMAGLAREDLFTVVLEQFQTDTADYADYVLPVTTFLENRDLYRAYGHYYLQLSEPAVAPPGECKSNVEIFRLLAEKMGFTDPCFRESEEDMIRGLLRTNSGALDGITFDRLDREHFIRLNVSPPGEPFLPFANGGFGTPSGRMDFAAAELEYAPPVESRCGAASRYPLEMVSGKNDDSMNSTFGYQAALDAETATAHLHSADAAARGIVTGDLIRMFNDRGSLRLRARVTDAIRPGVVRVPSSRWPKLSADRRNVNVLTGERLTDLGGGATFYNCLVEVERCGD